MKEKVILNYGDAAWAFQELAESLANILEIKITDSPGDYNYVLCLNEADIEQIRNKTFIPIEAIKLAADKRLLAQKFVENGISIPTTHLLNSYQEVVNFITENQIEQWCLKYPIGCGASGHIIINNIKDIPQKWLKPYVLQRFIKLKQLQVFRLYCAGGVLFGWNCRKYASASNSNPWVAHAKGAIYEVLNQPPREVKILATKAFKATYLFNSFGCIDLLQDNDGNWLVLEVGTDGIFNYVDRNIGNAALETEIEQRIADAFFKE